jgi:prefoldin subunit 5
MMANHAKEMKALKAQLQKEKDEVAALKNENARLSTQKKEIGTALNGAGAALETLKSKMGGK